MKESDCERELSRSTKIPEEFGWLFCMNEAIGPRNHIPENKRQQRLILLISMRQWETSEGERATEAEGEAEAEPDRGNKHT